MRQPQLYLTLILTTLLFFEALADQPMSLSIKQTLHTSIKPNESKLYSLKIQQMVPQEQDLYIRAEPTIPNPLQTPYLVVNADKEFKLKCYNARTAYSSICKIARQELILNRSFNISLSCSIHCQISLQTYLSNTLTTHLGKQITLRADDSDLATIVKVPIPKGIEFTSLVATAFIKNLEENIKFAKEGISMVLNYGFGRNISQPTQKQYMVASQELFSGGRVAFMDGTNVIPGFWVLAYIKIRKGMEIIFSLTHHDGSQQMIALGSSVFDLIKTVPQLYLINTGLVESQIQNNTIELVFDFYSGEPQVSVGFDAAFSNPLKSQRNHPSISIELTPELRKQRNFTGILTIMIESPSPCEYYFYSQIVNEDVTFLKPYTTYFDSLNSQEIYNYIFDQRYTIDKSTKQSNLRNYTFKINTNSGQGDIFFRRCYSLEMGNKDNQQNLQQCLVRSNTVLDDIKFVEQEIQVKKVSSGSLLNINLSYDITQCSLVEKDEAGKQVRECAFQIVTRGQFSGQSWDYSMEIQRKFHVAYLREGKITKEYLSKDSYSYFAFALPDYSDVTDIFIFTTTFSGQSVLLVSGKQHYPTISSNVTDLRSETGSKASIQLKKPFDFEELYISIFARSFTEVNLGVYVYRTGGIGIRQIKLQASNVIEYTMPKSEDEVHFTIEAEHKFRAIAHVNELVGMVSMKVLNGKKEEVQCEGKTSSRLSCQFSAEVGKYTMVVKGRFSQEQRFSVGFVATEMCKKGQLNWPISVSINGYGMECYSFAVNRAKDLEFMTSLTDIEILEDDVKVQLMLNQIDVSFVDPSHYTLAVRQMIKICQLGKISNRGDFSQTCHVSFNFVSYTKTPKEFQFILEEQATQMAIFDGISKQTNNIDVSIRDTRYYYYRVSQHNTIRIFSMTPSKVVNFLIVAKLVKKDEFAKRNGTSVYPVFIPKDKRQEHIGTANEFWTELDSVGTAVLTLQKYEILQFIRKQDCYLLISVFPDATDKQQQQNKKSSTIFTSFNIEIVQTQTILKIGQTKNGFVRNKSYDSYVITPQKALVSIRNLNQDGSRSMPCAILQGALPDGSIAKEADIVGGNLQITSSDKIEYIYVKGAKAKCAYQLSYINLDMPLHNAKLSQPYEMQLNADETKKFIYYHANPVSFKIVKLISAGSLKAFIFPMNRTTTLKQALEIPYSSYPIIDGDPKEHVVEQDDPKFCYNCYYLVVFISPDNFEGEVIFLRNGDSIPLATNHILKQWLLPESQFAQQKYIYFSRTNFNFSIQILQGQVQVKLIHPSGAVLYDEDVSKKRQFSIKSNLTNEPDLYYSSKTRYTVEVKGKKESQFFVRINKDKSSSLIFEGTPATFFVQDKTPLKLQFTNSQILDNSLTLMINIDTKDIPQQEELMKVKVSGLDLNGIKIEDGIYSGSPTLLLNTTQSGSSTFVLKLKNFKGTYFVTLNFNASVNITVLLFDKKLTHIKPNQMHLFDKEGLYHIFTKKQNVLVEIFNCQGDFSILASKDSQDLQKMTRNKSSPITLRRPNYAGHYVIGVEGMFGSYYMRVDSKEEGAPVEYLITYSHYAESNPYDLIDAKNYDLSFDESSTGIMIKFNRIQLVDEGRKAMKIQEIKYRAYAADSRVNLKRQSRCSINGPVAEKYVTNENSNVYLETELLEKAKINRKSSDNLFITLEAVVKVSYLDKDKPFQGPSQLRIFYNTLDLSEQKEFAYIFTDSFLILIAWLLIPFIIAGIVVFYLLRYCIRRIMEMQGKLVEQVQIVAAAPTIPSSSKLAAAAEKSPLEYPDSAKTQIKEQI